MKIDQMTLLKAAAIAIGEGMWFALVILKMAPVESFLVQLGGLITLFAGAHLVNKGGSSDGSSPGAGTPQP